jgi:hypothetical protein
MEADLARELVGMAEEDQRVRADLAWDGHLFRGYHPKMAEVHSRNAERLRDIIDQHGWPGRTLVGDRGARAAWLIVEHAIAYPQLMRSGLELIRDASRQGEVSQAEVAVLEDRIRVLEGRPQLYGTQYDWDDHGEMSPLPIEDPGGVDARRLAIGLPRLGESTKRVRDGTRAAGELPPADLQQRRQEAETWARMIGWRVKGEQRG